MPHSPGDYRIQYIDPAEPEPMTLENIIDLTETEDDYVFHKADGTTENWNKQIIKKPILISFIPFWADNPERNQ